MKTLTNSVNMTSPKLSKIEKEWLKNWLSLYYSTREIREMVRARFEKTITRQTLSYYRKKYKKEIEDNREKVKKEILAKAKKEMRIARLLDVLEKLGIILEQTPKIEVSREYRETIRQIRDEMDGLEEEESTGLTAADQIRMITELVDKSEERKNADK